MNSRLKAVLLTLILTTLTAAAAPAFINRAEAVDLTYVVVAPAVNKYYINTTAPGAQFMFNVSVVNVTNLQNWQIMLTYNDTYLNLVEISLPLDNVFEGANRSIIQGPPIVLPGSVTWGATYIIAEPSFPYWTFNGTGTLCQIALEILDPTTPLPISVNLTMINKGTDTFMIDGAYHDISFDILNGQFLYTYFTSVHHTATVPPNDYTIVTVSDGTIAPNAVTFPEGIGVAKVAFNVSGATGYTAFVNVSIPKNMMWVEGEPWQVHVNSALADITVTENSTHTFIYFELTFSSTETVIVRGTHIIPEPTAMLLLALMIASAAAVVISKTSFKKKW